MVDLIKCNSINGNEGFLVPVTLITKIKQSDESEIVFAIGDERFVAERSELEKYFKLSSKKVAEVPMTDETPKKTAKK